MKNLLILLLFIANLAYSANLIRDAEIEETIKLLAKPVIEAANLNPDDINIYIIADSNINAFVSNGSNIFINSGLLIGLNDPDAVIAVIAHELGHIRERHVIRTGELNKAANKFMIGSFLLAGLSAYAGSGELAIAMIGTGVHINERTILRYSREWEIAADRAAINYLDKSYNSSIGLLRSFNYFNQFSTNDKIFVNPYTVTHPLNSQRLEMVKTHLINHPSISNLNNVNRHKFIRILVKLKSFLTRPVDIFNIYQNSDINSLYAKSIASYKSGNIKEAVNLLKMVIKSEPDNLYLLELLGQFHFEYGQIDESIENYNKLMKLDSPLIKIELANSLIAKYGISNDKKYLNQVISLLNEALLKETDNPMILKILAIAYGKLGDIGQANLHLANEMVIYENFSKAKFFADKALKYLEIGSNSYIKANDIIETSILQIK